MQRFFDIFFVGIALFLFLPLLLPVALILKVTGEGKVLFSQQRVGLGGKSFGLLKFATMLKDSPNLGTGTVTVKNDPRVLPFGRILRKTKLNEVPQLINILLGDMSLIGPRPQTTRCFEAFSIPSQADVIKVRPGLSGIGSIVFRGEEELLHASVNPDRFYDEVIMPYKGKLERWYVAHQGLKLYFLCIIITVWVVFFPNTQIAWKILPQLPSPPIELRQGLAYT